MNPISFDYELDLEGTNNEYMDETIKNCDMYDLKKKINGFIFIYFDYHNSKSITLETGILDYILQFDILFSHINKGNNEAFTVSYDYYSNSLGYLYNSETGILTISETNNGLFNINCYYNDFKKAYEKFRKKVLKELVILYPYLLENKAFTEQVMFHS